MQLDSTLSILPRRAIFGGERAGDPIKMRHEVNETLYLRAIALGLEGGEVAFIYLLDRRLVLRRVLNLF